MERHLRVALYINFNARAFPPQSDALKRDADRGWKREKVHIIKWNKIYTMYKMYTGMYISRGEGQGGSVSSVLAAACHPGWSVMKNHDVSEKIKCQIVGLKALRRCESWIEKVEGVGVVVGLIELEFGCLYEDVSEWIWLFFLQWKFLSSISKNTIFFQINKNYLFYIKI